MGRWRRPAALSYRRTVCNPPNVRETEAHDLYLGCGHDLATGDAPGTALKLRNPGTSKPISGMLGAGPVDADDLADGLERVVGRLPEEPDEPVMVVGTVYDPSDGTRELPAAELAKGGAQMLHAFNDRILAHGD